jgi:triosephosphate isomerase (TIM)
VFEVGNALGEFERQNAQEFIATEFRRSLAILSVEQFARVIVAYEPFWAIGSGDAAAPEKTGEAHRLIRHQATESFRQEAAKEMRLLYGGSFKTENAAGLRAEPEIDGFLVGGASLNPKAFAAIVNLWSPPVS